MRWSVALLVLSVACGFDEVSDEGAAPLGESIGPDGGIVASADGVLSILIAPGALADDFLITIEESVDVPPHIGPAYIVSPGLALASPAVVTYRYELRDLDGRDPAVLTIGRIDGEGWKRLPRLSVDPVTQQVAVEDASVSDAYALLEDASLDTTTGGSSSGGGGSTSTTGG